MVKLSAKAMGKRKAAPTANGVSLLLQKRPKDLLTFRRKRRPRQKSIPVPRSEFAGRSRERAESGSEGEDEEEEDDMMDLGEEDEGIDASFLARINESELKR
jgi:hypothetical protein